MKSGNRLIRNAAAGSVAGVTGYSVDAAIHGRQVTLQGAALWGAMGSAASAAQLERCSMGGAAKVAGSGPMRGVLEVSGRMKSAAVRNWAGRDPVEFVYDPATKRFAMGHGAGPGSPHERLARAIGADESRVVGGMNRRDPSGRLVTNERSGHFWQNWSEKRRGEFERFMRDRSVDVQHVEAY